MTQKLGQVAVGTTVKLNVKSKTVEYVVVQQGNPNTKQYAGDFDDTTLLVNTKTAGRQVWGTLANKNNYEGASIRSWLQNNIVNKLDPDIIPFVKTVKIPYRAGDGGSSTVSQGAKGLECQIFLLSLKEVGLSDSTGVVEGTTFEYFKTDGQNRRIFDGVYDGYWVRTPLRIETGGWEYEGCYGVDTDGTWGITHVDDTNMNVRYVLPISGSLYVKDDGTIITNEPPTAPGSIDVSGVVSGGTATITLTAATDPDGTIASYRYERSVDGGDFVQFADVNSLTQTDTIDEAWGTVAYRACAVDDAGSVGPYVTSETETINSGWVLIGGPVSNLGVQSGPFDFEITIGVSGQSGVTDIAVYIKLDGEEKYNDTVNQDDKITIPIDARVMGSGKHEIQVVASKDEYLSAAAAYYFTVPSFTLPEGGRSDVLEGPDGQPIFPYTTSRNVIGPDGVNIQTEVDQIKKSHRGITGHLLFLDAVLGPASKKYERDSSTAYVVHEYAPIGTSNPGGLVCVYPGYTGQLDTFLTVSEAELDFTIPSNVVMSLYEFAMDALPEADVDPTVNFEALDQPRVLSAATNTGTAATDLNDALNQILKAFPAQNYYAMRSADGSTTYYIATASRVTADTTSITGAYVSSANPQKWYQGVQMTFLDMSNVEGLFTPVEDVYQVYSTTKEHPQIVGSGTTLKDTLIKMIQQNPTGNRYVISDTNDRPYYMITPDSFDKHKAKYTATAVCDAADIYYQNESLVTDVYKYFDLVRTLGGGGAGGGKHGPYSSEREALEACVEKSVGYDYFVYSTSGNGSTGSRYQVMQVDPATSDDWINAWSPYHDDWEDQWFANQCSIT